MVVDRPSGNLVLLNKRSLGLCGLVLCVAGLTARAGEMDRESIATSVIVLTDKSKVTPPTEMDRESPATAWHFHHGGWGYRPYYGWGGYRPYYGWGWGVRAGWGWGGWGWGGWGWPGWCGPPSSA